MTDDWSLKGRRREDETHTQCILCNIAFTKKNTFLKHLNEVHGFKLETDERNYDKKDIETLRRKLIEDIKELEPITNVDDNHEYIDGFHTGFQSAQDMLQYIINKRFGVD